MLVIVPNCLRRELESRLDEQIALHPGAAKDREHLYSQLLEYVNEYGVVPDFSLAHKASEVVPKGEG
jgi:hypothetical protein